jgi:phospho-2-dehydro-3-deoxyheptonate aldolase
MMLQGNPDTHIILRGGASGPNYAAEHVRSAAEKLGKAGLPQKIMVRESANRDFAQ